MNGHPAKGRSVVTQERGGCGSDFHPLCAWVTSDCKGKRCKMNPTGLSIVELRQKGLEEWGEWSGCGPAAVPPGFATGFGFGISVHHCK